MVRGSGAAPGIVYLELPRVLGCFALIQEVQELAQSASLIGYFCIIYSMKKLHIILIAAACYCLWSMVCLCVMCCYFGCNHMPSIL